jgi:hypothetical protein
VGRGRAWTIIAALGLSEGGMTLHIGPAHIHIHCAPCSLVMVLLFSDASRAKAWPDCRIGKDRHQHEREATGTGTRHRADERAQAHADRWQGACETACFAALSPVDALSLLRLAAPPSLSRAGTAPASSTSWLAAMMSRHSTNAITDYPATPAILLVQRAGKEMGRSNDRRQSRALEDAATRRAWRACSAA